MIFILFHVLLCDRIRNMKKIYFIFIGLFVANSVFAVPTVDARRDLCKTKPFDFVWVEKTQTCVPVNPCESKTQAIRDSYCVQVGVYVSSEENAKLMVTRYVERVLKRRIVGFVTVEPRLAWTGEYAIEVPYIGVHISDGGYYVFRFYSPQIDNFLAGACWAYGHEYIEQQEKEHEYLCIVASEQECIDIADFASVLRGSIVSGTVQKLGTLVCHLEAFD